MLVEEGVSQADLMLVSEQFFAALCGQPSSSSMTQTRYKRYNSQAGETCVHYDTAADALEYLPPRDGITCLSMWSAGTTTSNKCNQLPIMC